MVLAISLLKIQSDSNDLDSNIFDKCADMGHVIARHAELREDQDGHEKWNTTAQEIFKDILKRMV